ncbi:HD-GYP domain-containing protein [Terriglobus sp. RCC_193]|uniref:HD-GYP domain-containing protein n=1 Tax=Terriglobus sp. RCC_193 TaxID=3239218 RepID=UPI003525AF2C
MKRLDHGDESSQDMFCLVVEDASVSPLSVVESLPNNYWMRRLASYDPALLRHSLFVSGLSASFSAFLGQHVIEQRTLALAGLLHDIGKIEIPLPILNKPSLLTPSEIEMMQSHPRLGYEMLRKDGETNRTVLAVVRDHHERLDGSGYPRSLRATEIPVSVRLVTICDVFAAMTEVRPYAEPMRRDDALERMAGKRTRLDMELVSAFTAMVKRTTSILDGRLIPFRDRNKGG